MQPEEQIKKWCLPRVTEWTAGRGKAFLRAKDAAGAKAELDNEDTARRNGYRLRHFGGLQERKSEGDLRTPESIQAANPLIVLLATERACTMLS